MILIRNSVKRNADVEKGKNRTILRTGPCDRAARAAIPLPI